jgi:glutamine amidotransferase
MIVVIDFGMGNLRSVAKALETVGAEVEVTDNLNAIATASAIVIPGVGAFPSGMENLHKLKVIPVIYEAVRKRKPLLGICLGLQLLFTESEEHGICRGLDIIKGKVKKFANSVKVPHVGWNQVKIKESDPQAGTLGDRKPAKKMALFEDVPDNSYFCFVHSYYVEPEEKGVIAGTTEYGDEFPSVIAKDNIWGVQFHPEKSSELGLKVLENFLSMVG